MSVRQDHDQILELVIHSAVDLPKPQFCIKASPYVMADIISPDTKPNWVQTIIDEKGGENPVWDFVIIFPLNQEKIRMARNFNLFIKIMHSGRALGDRKIGLVKVRLSVLLAGAAAGENISYPVVSDGEERGRIVISHKLVTSTVGDVVPPPIGFQDPNWNLPVEFLNTDHNPYPILELVFHGAVDLPHPLFNHKGRPYILAAIVGLDTKPNWVKTITDEKDGENPVWDYVIQFPLNQEKVRMARNFNLVCKIMHFGNKLGDREIGTVKVRLQAFLAGAATGENIPYPVVVSGGEEKGKIVISHRLVTNTGVDVSAPPPPPPVGIHDHTHGAGERIKVTAGVITIAKAIFDFVGELN